MVINWSRRVGVCTAQYKSKTLTMQMYSIISLGQGCQEEFQRVKEDLSKKQGAEILDNKSEKERRSVAFSMHTKSKQELGKRFFHHDLLSQLKQFTPYYIWMFFYVCLLSLLSFRVDVHCTIFLSQQLILTAGSFETIYAVHC